MAMRNIKYLLDEELKELNRVLNKYMKTNERDCLLIRLALITGARASEILDLTLEDFTKDSVYIRPSKQGLGRDLPLRKDLIKRRVKVAKKQGAERICPISYQGRCQIWLTYRPVEKKLHSLRHTAAINMYKKTNNVRLVKYMLGHKSLTSTEIYQQYVFTQQELRKAFGVR